MGSSRGRGCPLILTLPTKAPTSHPRFLPRPTPLNAFSPGRGITRLAIFPGPFTQVKHVLHRDLKSSNIFLTTDNDLQVRIRGEGSQRRVQVNSTCLVAYKRGARSCQGEGVVGKVVTVQDLGLNQMGTTPYPFSPTLNLNPADRRLWTCHAA